MLAFSPKVCHNIHRGEMSMSFFRCPLCAAPLKRGEHSYTCPAGHSFDRSAAGYVHLLPANRKHSQNPGDDKAMVAARRRANLEMSTPATSGVRPAWVRAWNSPWV